MNHQHLLLFYISNLLSPIVLLHHHLHNTFIRNPKDKNIELIHIKIIRASSQIHFEFFYSRTFPNSFLNIFIQALSQVFDFNIFPNSNSFLPLLLSFFFPLFPIHWIEQPTPNHSFPISTRIPLHIPFDI